MSACIDGNEHSFQSFLTATLPPDPDQLKASDVASFNQPSSVKQIVESLTAKRYLIACTKCGLVLGGYAGKTAPEVVAEPVGDATKG